MFASLFAPHPVLAVGLIVLVIFLLIGLAVVWYRRRRRPLPEPPIVNYYNTGYGREWRNQPGEYAAIVPQNRYDDDDDPAVLFSDPVGQTTADISMFSSDQQNDSLTRGFAGGGSSDDYDPPSYDPPGATSDD